MAWDTGKEQNVTNTERRNWFINFRGITRLKHTRLKNKRFFMTHVDINRLTFVSIAIKLAEILSSFLIFWTLNLETQNSRLSTLKLKKAPCVIGGTFFMPLAIRVSSLRKAHAIQCLIAKNNVAYR